MRGQQSFSGVAPAGATVFRDRWFTGTSDPQEVCGAAQAVTSTRNQVSRRRLALTIHYLFHGRPPRRRVVHPSVLLTAEA